MSNRKKVRGEVMGQENLQGKWLGKTRQTQLLHHLFKGTIHYKPATNHDTGKPSHAVSDN